jgi:hypothetical protein
MLDVKILSDFELQKLDLRYKELQEERQRLDDDRRRFEVERATQAFQNKLVQNSIDRDNIYAKGEASERRAALKGDIQDRVEGESKDASVDEGLSARDIARKLRAQRLAVERKARLGNEDGASNVIESKETKGIQGPESKENDSDEEDIDSDSEADNSYADGSEADYEEIEHSARSGAWFNLLWLAALKIDSAWQEPAPRSKGKRAEEGQKEYEVILREERYRLKKASSFQDPDIEWRLSSTSYIVQDALEWNKILTLEEGFEVMQRVSFDDESSFSSEGSVSENED